MKLKKKYEMTFPYGGQPHHLWSIVGRHGAVHLHISSYEMDKEINFSGGLEIHHRQPPEYMKDDCPSQDKCWLLGQPCWHDGTSLYVSERIIPVIENSLRGSCGLDMRDHDTIFRILENRMIDEWPSEEKDNQP